METFSAIFALWARNSLVTGEFPSQRSVTRSFNFSLICAWTNVWVKNRDADDLRRHCSLWRHCNGIKISLLGARRHQVIIWITVDLSQMRSIETHLNALFISIMKMLFKTTFLKDNFWKRKECDWYPHLRRHDEWDIMYSFKTITICFASFFASSVASLCGLNKCLNYSTTRSAIPNFRYPCY